MRSNQHSIVIEWGDCDAAQIVFYPNYFRWFDACTHTLFRAMGIDAREMQRRWGVVIPLVDAQARFLGASAYGDRLDCVSRIAEWSRSSFKVVHRFHKGEALVVEGSETRVWCVSDPEAPKKIKAVPIPDEVIRLFESEG